MKQWILNGNGISFFTQAEQDKVTASTNPNLRFKAQHGFASSDNDPDAGPDQMPHLWCGDNIVGTWAEPAAVTAPPKPEMASSGDTAAILAELKMQTQILRAIAESTATVARAVTPQPVTPQQPAGIIPPKAEN